MKIREGIHKLTHKHTFIEKDGATVCVCRPRLRKHVYIAYQPWEGALWEHIESAAELSARLLPGSTDSEV